MIPYYQDRHVTLYNADCRSMTDLPDESIQCVVTSPPYWGLRKYAGEQDLIWGGDKDCRHEWGEEKKIKRGHSGNKSTLVGTQTAELSKEANTQGNYCQFCGAWRGAYGLEPTPEMYVQHTIEILREIRRVLRKDGVVFWNCGDSYFGGGRGGSDYGGKEIVPSTIYDRPKTNGILKPKDLCLIPFRVAIAAQEDGWWVRSVIIWSKNNPMPESVTDRPTEGHEYILMLTKSARYYWDAEAVREAWKPNEYDKMRAIDGNYRYQGKHKDGYDKDVSRDDHLNANCTGQPIGDPSRGRNLRSVWSFPTQGYPEAHFAVFPETLPERCIKAATPEAGCCPQCGTPWARVIEKKKIPRNELARDDERYRPNRYIDNKYANELRDGFECGMYIETNPRLAAVL